MIVVDISPLNQEFDVTSSNEWNMEHYFHCLKSVTFDHSKTLFQVLRYLLIRTNLFFKWVVFVSFPSVLKIYLLVLIDFYYLRPTLRIN